MLLTLSAIFRGLSDTLLFCDKEDAWSYTYSKYTFGVCSYSGRKCYEKPRTTELFGLDAISYTRTLDSCQLLTSRTAHIIYKFTSIPVWVCSSINFYIHIWWIICWVSIFINFKKRINPLNTRS